MDADRPPEIAAIFDEFARRGPFGSLAAANRALEQITRQHNARPQLDLGGLSPEQLHRLLSDDWASSQGAVILNESLSVEDAAGVPLLADARTMLGYVATQGPIKETAAHNLPRSAVDYLTPRLQVLAQRESEFGLEARGPLNEGEVYWLAPLRHVLMFAGLLMRRKGFRVTKRGRDLLEIERSAELYVLLFRTVFRVLDLRCLAGDEHPGLQRTVAYTFYRLGTCARDWASQDALAATAWLDTAKDPRRPWEIQSGTDLRHVALGQQVLRPLAAFGLLEMRIRPGPASEPWRRMPEYRVTPLYHQFFRFTVGNARAPRMRLVR